MDNQMKKGVVEMCLLRLLSRGDSYGYELIGEMVRAFPDLPERTVYAVLNRLRDSGYAETFFKDISAGPTRKYCRLTESGRTRLGVCADDWRELLAAVETIETETGKE